MSQIFGFPPMLTIEYLMMMLMPLHDKAQMEVDFVYLEK
jgi:hypothetical protein